MRHTLYVVIMATENDRVFESTLGQAADVDWIGCAVAPIPSLEPVRSADGGSTRLFAARSDAAARTEDGGETT